MNQWNQIKDPDINPHPYGHPILEKEAKIIQWKKKASSTNSAGTSGCLDGEECKQIHIYHSIQYSRQIESKTST